MPHDLPKTYDPAAIEELWAEKWAQLWADPSSSQGNAASVPPLPTQAFTMLLPPPNVTGRLHMGHMLNQTEMDILARWHRMRGYNTLWVPGTDHAGIATQMMVERQLISENTTRQALGRDAFIDRVWQWRDQYGKAILDQMKRLGASVDWSREYFTMDEGLSIAVREAFVRLHEQGLIYRGKYIVNWDPVQQTAVSDLEVVHEDRVGKLYHVRYPLADGSGSLVIATTRPETMLGDSAVAVNPDDPRYTAFLGKLLRLPLSGVHGSPDRTIPVLADTWANPEFGTGAVKVTPAHDPNDFAIGERHSLPQLTIMDAEARIDLPGSPYHGLSREDARKRIVDDLDTAGLLVEIKDHPMSIGLSQRTGAVIEPRLSTQWFLKIAPLAQKATAAVAEGHIRFTPEQYRKTYLNWMDNIHDWCISRQLWWGHRIPAWHCSSCQQVTVARTEPSTCTHCGSTQLTQETDVLDTWFSSGLLPFTVFGWPQHTTDLAALYPTSLLVTGSDILFFWVARMVMFGCWFMGQESITDTDPATGTITTRPRTLAESVPFREVYIHALVRDADRQKMSKTKGNVIDPIAIVKQYGTDAVRFTLASMASPGTDIAFSEQRTEGYRAFANKIWNAARFIFMNVDRAAEAGITVNPHTLATEPGSTTFESRWITARLAHTAAAVDTALHAYRYDDAANLIYQFFWGDLCDWYLEIVKLHLQFATTPGSATTALTHTTATERTLRTLLATFEASLRLLSPFMPFLTEELWHAIYDGKPPRSSIALAEYPQAAPVDDAVCAQMQELQTLIVSIRAIRKELGVEEKASVPVRIRASAAMDQSLAETGPIVERLARVCSIDLVTGPLEGAGIRSTLGFDVQVVYERQIDIPAETVRLTKELTQYEKEQATALRQLGNEGFLAKAPAPVVEGIRRRSGELVELLAKTRAALEALAATN
jgi:valyl-tRNA synthetase